MAFFNTTAVLDVPGGPPFEATFAKFAPFPYAPLRHVMPFDWTMLTAAIRIAGSTNLPGETCVVALAIGGVPTGAAVVITGPYGVPTVLPWSGLPLSGPMGSLVSWYVSNTGTGVVSAVTVCAIYTRTGQPAPTRGLMSLQRGDVLNGPGALYRGMFDQGSKIPGQFDYFRLGLPIAGAVESAVVGIQVPTTNNADAAIGMEVNGALLPTAFPIPPATPAGTIFYVAPPDPVFPVASGDVISCGLENESSGAGGVSGIVGLGFTFPI